MNELNKYCSFTSKTTLSICFIIYGKVNIASVKKIKTKINLPQEGRY